MALEDRSDSVNKGTTPDESSKASGDIRARRRTFSVQERVAIVWESHQPGVVVAQVASKYGIAENTLFAWRRIYGSRRIEEAIQEAAKRNPLVAALMTQVKVLEDLIERQSIEAERLRHQLARRERGRGADRGSDAG